MPVHCHFRPSILSMVSPFNDFQLLSHVSDVSTIHRPHTFLHIIWMSIELRHFIVYSLLLPFVFWYTFRFSTKHVSCPKHYRCVASKHLPGTVCLCQAATIEFR